MHQAVFCVVDQQQRRLVGSERFCQIDAGVSKGGIAFLQPKLAGARVIAVDQNNQSWVAKAVADDFFNPFLVQMERCALVEEANNRRVHAPVWVEQTSELKALCPIPLRLVRSNNQNLGVRPWMQGLSEKL